MAHLLKLQTLKHLHHVADQKYKLMQVPVKDLAPGMRLADDLFHESGFLVAPSGTDVDSHFIRVVCNHLACYAKSPFAKTIKVTVKGS